jgi:hypothetical protein
LPEKRKQRATVQVTLASAVFASENGWTFLLPPPEGRNEQTLADYVPILVSGMWHFPTVSVNGDPAGQLRAYLRRLGPALRNRNWHLLPGNKVRHAVTYRAITIQPYRINVKKLPRIKGAQEVPLHDIAVVPVSNLTRKVARAVLERPATS